MNLYPLRLAPGVDLLHSLQHLPIEQGQQAGMVLSGIGSLAGARLRLAGQSSFSTLRGDLEILSLAGSLSTTGAHLHISLAEGTTGRVIGGHLGAGSRVRTTAELLVVWLPEWTFQRVIDAATGCRELQIERRSQPAAVVGSPMPAAGADETPPGLC